MGSNPTILNMKIKNNLNIDYNKRVNYYTNETLLSVLKILSINNILNIQTRTKYFNILSLKQNDQIKIRNLCLITSRMRGNLKLFKLNRMQIKEYIKEAKITGIKSTSW